MGEVGIAGLRPPGGDWRDVLEMAALVDGLGYSCITTGEAWGQDAFTSLAQIAAVTSRIRIGTSIVPIFGRSPSNMAMTALNMDLMSEGRFFLGIGASGKLVIEDFHGERFSKPLTRMREYIDIIRKASRGERLEHDGEFFQTRRFRIGFQPYRADLPIYVASLSPPSLRLTGELADGWLPIFLAPSRMDDGAGRAPGRRGQGRPLTGRRRVLAAGLGVRHRRRTGGARPRATAHSLLHRRYGSVLPPVHAPYRLRRGVRPYPRSLSVPRQGASGQAWLPTKWLTR